MEELIEINPKIMVGKPVIKGTRIKVEMILEKLAAGESIDEILMQHPRLNREQILACIELEVAFTTISKESVRMRKSF